MKLDLRTPTLVFLGAWNPAIFTSKWIARYLFQKPEGERIFGSEVTILSPIFPRRILFLDNVGIHATNEKVEIFVNADDEDVRRLAESVVTQLISTLPHTPLGGFGVNFRYLENDTDDPLLDKFVTGENIEQHEKILKRVFSSTLEVDDGVKLNLTRHVSESEVIFDFNYHHDALNRERAGENLSGVIRRYLGLSLGTLRDIYGLDEYEVLTHEFNLEAEAANRN